MTKEEMKKMLQEQETPCDNDLENLLAFTNTNRHMIFNVIDAFNYGIIMGKRIERSKKHSG